MMSDYAVYSDFNPLSYIKQKYGLMSEYLALPLKELHFMFQSLDSGMTVLEYGCGPIPIYLCSAPTKATEIVFAEYEARNRGILQSWLNKEPTAPDYTPIFKYVVQELEGQTDDKSVIKRQDDLRSLVKAVVPCDVNKDPPIDANYQGPYDVIICSLCLSVTATNISEYSRNVKKVADMLKHGGKLVINSVEARDNQTYFDYWVGKEKFIALSLTVELLKNVLKENKFDDDFKVCYRLVDDTPYLKKFVSPQALATILIIATKK